MPKKGNKFISGFLIPSLNTERFGELLKWLDKKTATFQLHWNHKGAPSWSENDAAVFKEWDIQRGHYVPGDKEYYTKSKQRFRSLLNKLISENHIKAITSGDKRKKIFQIVGKHSGETNVLMLSDDDYQDENNEPDQALLMYSTMPLQNSVQEIHQDHRYANLNGKSNKDPECTDQYSDAKNDSLLHPWYHLVNQVQNGAFHTLDGNEPNPVIKDGSMFIVINIIPDKRNVTSGALNNYENAIKASEISTGHIVQDQNHAYQAVEMNMSPSSENLDLVLEIENYNDMLQDEIPLNYSVLSYGSVQYGDVTDKPL